MSLRHTPALMTACILLLGPSERYPSAQHVSASTSLSASNSRRASTGRHGDTLSKSAGGFLPRHRLLSAQTAFRFRVSRCESFARILQRCHKSQYGQNTGWTRS